MVSREMARIRERLEKERTEDGNFKTFLVPICLEGKFEEIFSNRHLKEYAGYTWTNWPNYDEIFKLLKQIFPQINKIINDCQENFKSIPCQITRFYC
ncbi:MAG: hypothetical protein HWD59_14650 [Coxiellaceae bacterium]|nr:MAG: hypothetical protein HWD59_14650 [Coxiellaceae bacterium]